MKPKIISEKINYKGLWFSTRGTGLVFPDGTKGKWEDIISDDAVAIVALDNKNNIYFSKEWRSSWKKEILQITAGMCKGKKYNEIIKQAKNELSEELGLGARKWKKLTTYLLGGRIKSKIHVFLAQDLYESKKTPDEGEFIEVVKMPFKKACKILLDGTQETTSYTVIGLALAKDRLKL